MVFVDQSCDDGSSADGPQVDYVPATPLIPQQKPQLTIRNRVSGRDTIDATLTDVTTLKLCRLRYVGSASQWQFAIYRASHDELTGATT